jgi:hypothetical protein
MENWLATSPWPGVILWIILYTSDYYLTIYSARGFREIGHFQFEGSFELTPQYQKDIDGLKPVSKLHVTLLFLYSLVIAIIWWFFVGLLKLQWAYLLYLGMFILLEVAVHLRHLRNVFMVNTVRKSGGVEGQVRYQKQFSYKISAFEFTMLGFLFLITAILVFSTFFLGGAIMCFGTCVRHSILAKKAKTNPAQTVEPQT